MSDTEDATDLLAALRASLVRPSQKAKHECPECEEPTDAGGVTLSDCPGGSGEKCDECLACSCDGSC